MRPKISSIEQLLRLTDEHIQKLMQSNLQELHLTTQQIHTLKRQKRKLRQMLRRCGIGDLVAKNYVKQTIHAIIMENIQLTEEEIECLLPLRDSRRMSKQDMFEIMLCCYKRNYATRALEQWILEHRLEESRRDKQGIYEITGEQVQDIFLDGNYSISKMEQFELIVQRVYADYRGLGIIDDLRDLDLDGISGGVNGIGEEERSVWIMFQGKSIYLSFLQFGSKKNLQRICRTIYRYGQPGQLSRKKGYIVNEMADHARVVVARPDFCENWVFFVRKLDNLKSQRLEDLFTEEGAEWVVLLLSYIVKGCQTIAITGEQGSGKTTLLMALIAYIAGNYTLRIQETAFELQLRQLYPERNIVSFRETDAISGQEGLDFQKKTDGAVSIVGEVASAKQAAWMLQLGQTASLYTMFTHHANSTRNLIWALQNNLLQVGQFSNERIAQQQVVEVVRFHVHLVRNVQGGRFIGSITEIVPDLENKEKFTCYKERSLLVYEDGRYQLRQNISMETIRKMALYLEEGEKEVYEQQMLSALGQASLCEQEATEHKATYADVLSRG